MEPLAAALRRPRWRARSLPALLLAAALGPGPAAASEVPAPRRLSAEEIECPAGASVRWGPPAHDGRRALWCEAHDGSEGLRHGPYAELFADGTTARQGQYTRGLQTGRWVRWSGGGEIERDVVLWLGEASRHLPEPEELCPPGTERQRTTGYDHRERLWSRCNGRDEHGKRVLEGPYVTWDAERSEGRVRYLLRELVTYRAGKRHGPHLVFEGAFGEEALVEEETWGDGLPHGESRSFYRDGAVREIRHYREGVLDGVRVAFFPDGGERWRVTYEAGRRVAAEGDLTVARQPCPPDTEPTLSADGLEEHCARRRLHSLERHGPFVIRDPAGAVVESGLYHRDRIVQLWQTSGGELSPRVPDDVLVAEGVLLIGERVYAEAGPAPPRAEAAWRSATLAPGDPAVLEESETEESVDLHIWLRDQATRQFVSANTVVDRGRVEVYGLSPGRYYLGIHIDAAPDNPMRYPGDLTAGADFEVELGRVTRFEVALVRTLHLVEPFDNESPVPGWGSPCGEEAELPRRARFAWRPPAGEDPGAIEYEYRLRRFTCEPFQRRETLAEGRTVDTAVALELEPSLRAQGYEFELVAWRGEHRVGHLMSFGEQGYGWSLRFRVR